MSARNLWMVRVPAAYERHDREVCLYSARIERETPFFYWINEADWKDSGYAWGSSRRIPKKSTNLVFFTAAEAIAAAQVALSRAVERARADLANRERHLAGVLAMADNQAILDREAQS